MSVSGCRSWTSTEEAPGATRKCHGATLPLPQHVAPPGSHVVNQPRQTSTGRRLAAMASALLWGWSRSLRRSARAGRCACTRNAAFDRVSSAANVSRTASILGERSRGNQKKCLR